MLELVIAGVTLVLLPIVSVVIGVFHSEYAFLWLVGRWFVFWAVGVRLLIIGARQIAQPAVITEQVLGMEVPEADRLVRALGGAHVAIGFVGVVSILNPEFVLPMAIVGFFHGVIAAVGRLMPAEAGNSMAAEGEEDAPNLAELAGLAGDVWIAIVLGLFAIAALI